MLNDEAKKEIYRASEYTYSFQNFRTIKAFDRDIYNCEITLKEAHEDQASLLVKIINFKKKTKPLNQEKKQEKKVALKNLYNFFEGREKYLMLLIVKYFP